MDTCILAIESSCDDTSASVSFNGKIRNNILANQKVHQKYGGVVPELASRDHQKNIIPVVHEALSNAGVSLKDLSAIAFTQGPGLLGSLLVGCTLAKSFAFALQKPLIAVNHMKAHVLAHFIDAPFPEFPFLCLTVSGGHTQFVLVNNYLDMKVIGQTQDDAVGEAFDKTAKLLGLPYPGGPQIDAWAKKGDPKRFPFPMPKTEGYNFSFSGIKTSILYFLKDGIKGDPHFIENNMADICASVQYALVKILLSKFEKAIVEHGIKHVGIAGGVSANSGLRSSFEAMGAKLGVSTYVPDFQYCTDNAAMIATAAYYQFLAGDFASNRVVPEPRLGI